MYIQSGIQNLNQQQDLGKKREKSPLESKDFEDVMEKTTKNKRPADKSRSEKKSASKEKDNRFESGDGENIQSRRVEHRTVKDQDSDQKQSESPIKVVSNEKESKENNTPVVRNSESLLKENTKVQALENQNFDSAITDETQPLSTNSSEPSKITLEENQKKLNQIEKAFSEIMNESKLQNKVTPQKGMLAQAMVQGEKGTATPSNLKPFAQNGKMKIESDMTLNNEIETFQGSNAQENPLKTIVKSGEKGEMDQNFSSFEQMISGQGELQGKSEGVSSAFADELGLAQTAGKSQKIENLQSIIKQARAVVDDGGGTMEIHLQPEGLGKVHLKVAVNEGQVNVEMMADNQLAKKALEEGILDIKQALEGHKLLVDTVKVEMSSDYQKDFSDLQDHMQEQENRDFAEQFLGQFQQERDQRLGGLFDSFRNFQPEAREPELSLGQRNPYSENGKGRSINLVA